MMDLDQNLPLNSKFWIFFLFMSFNIIDFGVTVVINDYHHHLRGEGSRVFIKELHDSYVGCACNDCNGSTICINIMNRKLPD